MNTGSRAQIKYFREISSVFHIIKSKLNSIDRVDTWNVKSLVHRKSHHMCNCSRNQEFHVTREVDWCRTNQLRITALQILPNASSKTWWLIIKLDFTIWSTVTSTLTSHGVEQEAIVRVSSEWVNRSTTYLQTNLRLSIRRQSRDYWLYSSVYVRRKYHVSVTLRQLT